VITASALTKTFGQTTALAAIDLSIERGECVALIGSARDGRATLMRILATLIPPSSGRIVVAGLDAVADVYRVRRLVAYAGSDPIPANRLRVVEYLRLVAGTHRQPSSAAAAAADLVGLTEDTSIATLPDGLRNRLPLAAAVAAGADVLLLDDVFRALDAPARDRVCEWLVAARERGTTIIVASSEESVAGLCQQTFILRGGRTVPRSEIARDRAARSEVLVGA